MSPASLSQDRARISKLVRDLYEEEYLGRPDEDELRCIEAEFAAIGFPGCVGCIDCMHVAWKNCPVGQLGIDMKLHV